MFLDNEEIIEEAHSHAQQQPENDTRAPSTPARSITICESQVLTHTASGTVPQRSTNSKTKKPATHTSRHISSSGCNTVVPLWGSRVSVYSSDAVRCTTALHCLSQLRPCILMPTADVSVCLVVVHPLGLCILGGVGHYCAGPRQLGPGLQGGSRNFQGAALVAVLQKMHRRNPLEVMNALSQRPCNTSSGS